MTNFPSDLSTPAHRDGARIAQVLNKWQLCVNASPTEPGEAHDYWRAYWNGANAVIRDLRAALAALPSEPPEQSEDNNIVAKVTAVVREADQTFERVGGSSRHWVRDCFLPLLNNAGLQVLTGPILIAPCSAEFAARAEAVKHIKECEICTPLDAALPASAPGWQLSIATRLGGVIESLATQEARRDCIHTLERIVQELADPPRTPPEQE